MFEVAVHFAFVVAFFDGFTLVERLFTFGYGNVEFGQALFVEEEFDGNDGKARFLGESGEFGQFALGEQQFAVTLGYMVVVGTERVLRDLDVLRPEFAVLNDTIAIR